MASKLTARQQDSDGSFFHAPAILIHLDQQRDKVVCRTYSSDGRLHSNAPMKFIAPELLPVLLYQLLTRGYHLQPYAQEVEVYIAMSGEFVDRQRASSAGLAAATAAKDEDGGHAR